VIAHKTAVKKQHDKIWNPALVPAAIKAMNQNEYKSFVIDNCNDNENDFRA